MTKTAISAAVGLAFAFLSSQALADSTFATDKGTNTVPITGEAISLSQPNRGFFLDQKEKTTMYALVAAQGNGADQANTITIGDENTLTVNLDATANLDGTPDTNGNRWISTVALYAQGKGANIEVQAADSVTITSNDIGILTQSNSQDATRPENAARLSISSRDISVVADNQAVMAFSNSEITLSATNSIYLEAANAIDTRGNSLINVNTDNLAQKVTIVGDVVFETPSAPGDSQNSGNIINSQVTINLTTAESSWTGRAYQSYRVQQGDGSYESVENVELNSDPYVGNVTGFTANLSNGAEWTVTGDSFINTANISDGANVVVTNDVGVLNADKIALNNGTLSLQGNSNQKVNVNTLSGTGGAVNVAATANADGTLSTPTLSVGSVDASSEAPATLSVTYTGITSDQITQENADNLNPVNVTTGTENLTVTEYAAEGDINGAWSRQNGEGSGDFADNTKLANFSSVNAMSLVQWRNEINHLTKRLGDIRNAQGDIGAWARVYGGESQWGGSNEVEMDHTTIQVGGDYRLNNQWIVGGAFSYTNSDANLNNGESDGDSYSLAAYATYMADGGSFLDLVARYGYLKNDITAGNMDLDTSSSAFSLSAETGHTFRFIDDRAYVEPQIEFTYGFVSGDDTTASNGVKIDQDDFQSFITRVGVRAGYDFPEKKGSFYGMVSYSYDWLGDADGVASKGDLRQALNEDLGGGWVTYGIGAQFMMGDSAYFYGELERTSGGDIDNPYLFSAGVRMVF